MSSLQHLDNGNISHYNKELDRMARKRSGEPLQMCGVRMAAALLARIDAYGESLKAEHPGMSIERADVIRELVHVGLGVVEARNAETRIDTWEGPVLTARTMGQDQQEDLHTRAQDQS
jgi:hypothetical protein